LALPIFLFLAGLFAAAIWAFQYYGEGRDERTIRVERAARLARASLGLPLAGTPDFSKLSTRLSAHGVKLGDPVFVRIFKRDFELELWMQRDGRFHKFQTYPICRWSGLLGPKIAQGDKQAPEGFYTVDSKALNPNSRWHRSFNLGFPNAFDQSLGRTGSFIMVHGGCGSVGCYAMTNPAIDELWQIITAALAGSQKRFQVQVFPFRMSAENIQEYSNSQHAAFWNELKAGYDLFEVGNVPPKVSVCGQRYVVQEPGRVLDGSLPIETDCTRESAKKA
jgi:murein L,D-transpeptidase YafK